MNDQDFEQTRDRIRQVFRSLRDALNLDQVNWDEDYVRERDACHDDGTATLAEIFPNWQYGTATIRFFVPMFVDKDDDEIADIILHEFGHFWLNPVSRYGSSKEYDLLEERVCTEIARAIKTAISTAGERVADHWRLEVKRAQKELKALRKQQEGAA